MDRKYAYNCSAFTPQSFAFMVLNKVIFKTDVLKDNVELPIENRAE